MSGDTATWALCEQLTQTAADMYARSHALKFRLVICQKGG